MCCCMVLWVLFRVPTQQHILTKCVVVWCCGCCFEYPQQHILAKCVVVWCCGCCFEYPQQHILTKCVVVWCCGCCFEYPQQHILPLDFQGSDLGFLGGQILDLRLWYTPPPPHEIISRNDSQRMCRHVHSQRWLPRRWFEPATFQTLVRRFNRYRGGSRVVGWGGGGVRIPQHHTTHFVNGVVVCHLWTIVAETYPDWRHAYH